MKRLLICLFLSPLILCGCTRHLVSEDIPDQTPIDASVIEEFDFAPIEASTEEEYVEAAKAAGYVVNDHEAGSISGEEMIEDFYKTSRKGERCCVGIIDHYISAPLYVFPDSVSGDDETEYYIPRLSSTNKTELIYDGEYYGFVRYSWDSDEPIESGRYKYLMKYEGEIPGLMTSKSSGIHLNSDVVYGYEFILVNNNTMTWEDIYKRNLTSYTKDNIANHSVMLVLNKQERK